MSYYFKITFLPLFWSQRAGSIPRRQLKFSGPWCKNFPRPYPNFAPLPLPKKSNFGFGQRLFLAAMQNISPALYDAAKIDGANRWQEFRHITVPGILPTLSFMLLMTGIWSFLVFDYVWILTQGGPAGASEVMATYLYKQAFNRFEAGYASAIGLSMSLFAGMIISVFVFLRTRGWEI